MLLMVRSMSQCDENKNIGVKYTNEFLSTQKKTNQWIFVEFCKLLLQYCYRGDRCNCNQVHLLLSIFQGQGFLPKQQVANSLPGGLPNVSIISVIKTLRLLLPARRNSHGHSTVDVPCSLLNKASSC